MMCFRNHSSCPEGGCVEKPGVNADRWGNAPSNMEALVDKTFRAWPDPGSVTPSVVRGSHSSVLQVSVCFDPRKRKWKHTNYSLDQIFLSESFPSDNFPTDQVPTRGSEAARASHCPAHTKSLWWPPGPSSPLSSLLAYPRILPFSLSAMCSANQISPYWS